MQHSYMIDCPHLQLNPMNEESAERYRGIRNLDENRKCFFDDKVITAEQQKMWYCHYLKADSDYMFGILSKSNRQYIGGIGIYEIDPASLTGEIGRILIDRTYSKNGYGAEAIGGLLHFASEKLRLNTLYAHILSDNIASIKSFEKNGFTLKNKNGKIVQMMLCLK